ncbi:MAG: hypothetical protein A2104_10365 [Candidatus Melainabacteria bacterium GWF2_32_7]|nr:MAG: hypothetical protein A2104_10365 [Candidatus Melainabacteria bacterium GWF2_32_7]OGI22900.1 MAG: hypothetical protein A2255_05725 [Candidatus Melainabacteria bacterium RIFOXYA2_FULL_32_9]
MINCKNTIGNMDLLLNKNFSLGGNPVQGTPQGQGNKNDISIFEALKNDSKPQSFSNDFSKFDTQAPALDTNETLKSFIQTLMTLVSNLAAKNQIQNNPAAAPTATQGALTPPATNPTTPTLGGDKQVQGDKTGKLSQAMQLVKDYVQKTGNLKLMQALQDPKLQIMGADLPAMALGMQEDNTIQLNNKNMDQRSVEEIASTLIHELNHYSLNTTNSLKQEMQCEQIAEDFLDYLGKGEFDDANEVAQIDESVRTRYKGMGLPETA